MPVTELALRVDAMAEDHTVPGLVQRAGKDWNLVADIKNAISPYLDLLRRLPRALEESFEKARRLGPLPIDANGHHVTASILRTLKTYYDAQDEIMAFLNKHKKGPAADFFVETVLFHLKVFLETHNLPLIASSEETIKLGEGSIRPDISIKQGEELVAIIECKTNIGWNRYAWENDFVEREVRVQKAFRSARCFLVVATEKNWPGFGDNPRVGDQFFALSKVWPSDVDLRHIEDSIKNPIEPLFQEIRGWADGSRPERQGDTERR